jgi:phage baseplate assembly protein W
MSIYKGFNTIDRDFGPYYLTDNALIIRDFLNNLYTKKGEKLMNPNYGSIIWQSLFEPMTPSLQEAIRADIQTIANNDPRILNLNQIVVQSYDNGIRIDIQITFSSNNQVANLSLQFDQNTQTVTAL